MAGTPQRGTVLTQARELVRLARQHGYRRDEPIQIIESLPWPALAHPGGRPRKPDRGNGQVTITKPRRTAMTESDRIPVRFAASPLPNAE